MDIDELNKKIFNRCANINSIKGFEIITEALVYKIYDLYGRNTLLSMLYQIGSLPGKQIADRIKKQYNKEVFGLEEAFEILFKELKDFYSVQIKEVEESDEKLRMIIENYCFLREPISHRKKLKYGKAFCRINKGYFEVALKELLGDKIKNVEINYLETDDDRDACIEEVIFYKNTNIP